MRTYRLEIGGNIVELNEERQQRFISEFLRIENELKKVKKNLRVSACMPFEIRNNVTSIALYIEFGAHFLNSRTMHFDFDTEKTIRGDIESLEDYAKRIIEDISNDEN